MGMQRCTQFGLTDRFAPPAQSDRPPLVRLAEMAMYVNVNVDRPPILTGPRSQAKFSFVTDRDPRTGEPSTHWMQNHNERLLGEKGSS